MSKSVTHGMYSKSNSSAYVTDAVSCLAWRSVSTRTIARSFIPFASSSSIIFSPIESAVTVFP